MVRTQFLSFAILLATTTSIFADAELVHAPQYVHGMVIRSEADLSIEQTLTIAGMDVETTNETFIVTEEIVKEMASDKIVLHGQLKVLQSNIGLPGGQSVGFDSGNPDAEIPAGPLAEAIEFMKLVSSTTWESTLNGKGIITDFHYPEDFLNQVPEPFKAEVSGEKRIRDQKMLIDRLPGKTVAVGDSWERNEEANLGSGQKFYLVKEFTYAGPTDSDGRSLEKITFVTKSVKFEIEGNAVPVEVKSSDLKIESSTGTLLYDPQSKVIVKVDDDMHIIGDLTLIANGMELPSKLDLKMHTITKISRTTK